MPLMQLAATAIDRTAAQCGRTIDEIVSYAGTDLVCYRAERPPELVARQSATWQPLVDWVTLRFDAALLVTTGVVPKAQPSAAIAAIRAAVEPLDPFWLTALHNATAACGSAAIGLALVKASGRRSGMAGLPAGRDLPDRAMGRGLRGRRAPRRAQARRRSDRRFHGVVARLSVTGWHDVAGGAIHLFGVRLS
jgi:hypothetical protein